MIPRRSVLTQTVLRARYRWCIDQKLYFHDDLSPLPKHWWKPLGTPHKNGHSYVYIAGHRFNLRDVVWVWHRGPLPPSGIKHADGDPSNNVPENLVPVVPSEWVSFM